MGAAADAETDVIATPCPLCQQNVEIYQDAINKKFRTDHKIPVVFYSQLMAVAFGMDPEKDAALRPASGVGTTSSAARDCWPPTRRWSSFRGTPIGRPGGCLS